MNTHRISSHSQNCVFFLISIGFILIDFILIWIRILKSKIWKKQHVKKCLSTCYEYFSFYFICFFVRILVLNFWNTKINVFGYILLVWLISFSLYLCVAFIFEGGVFFIFWFIQFCFVFFLEIVLLIYWILSLHLFPTLIVLFYITSAFWTIANWNCPLLFTR